MKKQARVVGISMLAVLGIAMGALSASANPVPGESNLVGSRSTLFADALAEARSSGAGQWQILALEAAAETDEVTIDTAREGALRAVACMVDAGFGGEVIESQTARGILPEAILNTNNTAEGFAKADACRFSEDFWISKVFQLQPTAQAALEQFVEERSELLRACLESHGYVTEPGATGAELADKAAQIAFETCNRVNCLSEAGIDVW